MLQCSLISHFMLFRETESQILGAIRFILKHWVYCCFLLCSGEAVTAGDKYGGEAEQEGEWAASGDRAPDCSPQRTWLVESRAGAADEWQSVTYRTTAGWTRPLCRNWRGAVFFLYSALHIFAFLKICVLLCFWWLIGWVMAAFCFWSVFACVRAYGHAGRGIL